METTELELLKQALRSIPLLEIESQINWWLSQPDYPPYFRWRRNMIVPRLVEEKLSRVEEHYDSK